MLQVKVSTRASSPAKHMAGGKGAKSRQSAQVQQSNAGQEEAAGEAAAPESEEASQVLRDLNAGRAQPGNAPDEPADRKLRQKPSSSGRAGSLNDRGKPKGYVSAISVNGFTTRGRVRQKSHKSAQLVNVGKIRWLSFSSLFLLEQAISVFA